MLSGTQHSKGAESPAKQPSLPPRPMDQNTDPMEIDSKPPHEIRTIPPPSSRAASTQPKITLKVGPSQQQAPRQKPAITPPATEPMKGKQRANTAEEIQRLQAENAESEKKIQDIERQLNEQRALTEEILNERDKVASQAEENWKLWKQTARELRKAKQAPSHYQVTDSQLTGLIQQLRYSIRDFAVQYFTGIPRSQVSRDRLDVWESCVVSSTPGTAAYQEYIRSPSRCASIIQAMLWRLLDRRVFGNFVWAGKAGESLCDLRFYLKYSSRNDPTPDFDLERKFQIWSSEASALILQMCDFTEGSQEYKRVQSTCKEIREEFWSIASQYLSKRSNAPGQDLRRILDNAMALDREIHRQAARITWEFPPEGAHVRFNPKFMEAEKGQQKPKGDQQVLLIVAPGVVKRGKSDGQDFGGEEQLLVASPGPTRCASLPTFQYDAGRIARLHPSRPPVCFGAGKAHAVTSVDVIDLAGDESQQTSHSLVSIYLMAPIPQSLDLSATVTALTLVTVVMRYAVSCGGVTQNEQFESDRERFGRLVGPERIGQNLCVHIVRRCIAENTSYLGDIINETLRLQPAILTGGYRITPAEGMQVDEVYNAGDVNVFTPVQLIQADERHYDDRQFVPKLWGERKEMIIRGLRISRFYTALTSSLERT
ncbi:hypothetical protein BDW71DRAFT_202838 [Aspergillus fruticulosus]